MHYVQLVHRFQTSHHLDQHFPDFWLIEEGLTLLMLRDFLEQVPIVRILHHYTAFNVQSESQVNLP